MPNGQVSEFEEIVALAALADLFGQIVDATDRPQASG